MWKHGNNNVKGEGRVKTPKLRINVGFGDNRVFRFHILQAVHGMLLVKASRQGVHVDGYARKTQERKKGNTLSYFFDNTLVTMLAPPGRAPAQKNRT